MSTSKPNWDAFSRAEIRATLFSQEYDRAIELITFLAEQPNNPYIEDLITLLAVSDHHWVRVALGEAFYDLADPRTLQPLMQAITHQPKAPATSALVRACTQFDGSPYLETLVEHVLHGSGESAAWALIAIRQMLGPFGPEQLHTMIHTVTLVKTGSPNEPQLDGVISALQAKEACSAKEDSGSGR